MGKVVFSGHGTFLTDTNPPWVEVPSGSTLYFFSDNLKALLDSNGQTVETMSSALNSITPSQVVQAGSRCPNYTLSPPDGLDIKDAPDDVEQVIVSSDETLATLLTKYSGDIYWAACRCVDLDEVGGKFLGVNEGQDKLGGSDSSVVEDREMRQVSKFIADFPSLGEDERLDRFDKMSYEQQQGIQLRDENIRQWVARAYDDKDKLNNDEMDGFLQWWSGTATDAERKEAWGDLSSDQQDAIRQRYADTIPKKSIFGKK